MITNYLSRLNKKFYIIRKIDFTTNGEAEALEYNDELITTYYKNKPEITNKNNSPEDRLDLIFCNNNLDYQICFEPLIFNEIIALECGLIPIKYNKKGMLASPCYGMELIAWLGNYELLANIIINNRGNFFTSTGKISKNFKNLMDKNLAEKILKIYLKVSKTLNNKTKENF
ncbi:hypothetical protein [Rickettsia endosymbiont of Orchestes rusci]|uniref:hypothetical protein n=1 Tax=Rickettsia endosymbiont of Orchestes rusci TaxID=3066250 RepID=UPI00313D8B44